MTTRERELPENQCEALTECGLRCRNAVADKTDDGKLVCSLHVRVLNMRAMTARAVEANQSFYQAMKARAEAAGDRLGVRAIYFPARIDGLDDGVLVSLRDLEAMKS